MKLDDCIEEFLTYIFSVRSLSQNTVDAYREDYKHLKVVQKENIEDFDINDFRFCIGVMSKAKYSVTSINRFMAATRTLFAYAKKFGYIQKNPGLELKSLRIPKYLPKFMTQSEIDNLCKEPDNAKMLWPARDKAIFEMLYSSGCRVSELASICFSDFAGDFSSVVVTGKGKKDRRVYFEKDARDALAAYLKERKERFPQCEKNGGTPVPNIFINQKGTALSVHGIWYIVTSYSGPGGTNHQVSPHSFRHTFATQMLNSGADIRAVQEMLGHASISTTQRYTHVTTERLKEIYKHAFPHK